MIKDIITALTEKLGMDGKDSSSLHIDANKNSISVKYVEDITEDSGEKIEGVNSLLIRLKEIGTIKDYIYLCIENQHSININL